VANFLEMFAGSFFHTRVRAGCCSERRLIVRATILIAANFVAALIVATALCGRNISAIVFILIFIFIIFISAIAAWEMTSDGSHEVIGWRNGTRLDPRSPEIRKNFLGLNLTLAQCGKIVSYGFFLVKADLAGVGAHETFIEDSAGKLVKVFVFKST